MRSERSAKIAGKIPFRACYCILICGKLNSLFKWFRERYFFKIKQRHLYLYLVCGSHSFIPLGFYTDHCFKCGPTSGPKFSELTYAGHIDKMICFWLSATKYWLFVILRQVKLHIYISFHPCGNFNLETRWKEQENHSHWTFHTVQELSVSPGKN